jgi:hypothetical protein
MERERLADQRAMLAVEGRRLAEQAAALEQDRKEVGSWCLLAVCEQHTAGVWLHASSVECQIECSKACADVSLH